MVQASVICFVNSFVLKMAYDGNRDVVLWGLPDDVVVVPPVAPGAAEVVGHGDGVDGTGLLLGKSVLLTKIVDFQKIVSKS